MIHNDIHICHATRDGARGIRDIWELTTDVRVIAVRAHPERVGGDGPSEARW